MTNNNSNEEKTDRISVTDRLGKDHSVDASEWEVDGEGTLSLTKDDKVVAVFPPGWTSLRRTKKSSLAVIY